MDIRREVEAASGQSVAQFVALSGGCIGQVYRVVLTDGRKLVIKLDEGHSPRLNIEGNMLRYLAAHSELPVPDVLHSSARLLIMSWVAGSSRFNPAVEEDAADHLAALHARTAPQYGLAWDSLIGGLHQPNTPCSSWIAFFRDQRLRYMAAEAVSAGQVPQGWLHRIDRLAANLDEWLLEPARPSLLHGDVWTTNVLAQDGRITAFLDPAIYYGHPEMELAFIALFNTFGDSFFARYRALRPVEPGFEPARRDLYNLYPLLVHCRLFGGGYVSQVDRILERYGY